MSFSITRGKEMSHLKIIDAKYKAGDDIDFGTVIGELKVEDEKEISSTILMMNLIVARHF